MRKSLLFSAMLLVASCTVQKEEEFENPAQHRYHAVAEEPVDAETRVYADKNLRVRWNEGDRISIFERRTYNQEYEFLGDNGDTAGDFDPVESSGYHTSDEIADGFVYAVYPYDKKNKCDYEGKLTVTFPSTQHYKKDSFGIGANVMVAKTNTLDLRFMHVGGYRTFKLYGDGVSVSSVRIESNGPEYLAGRTDVVIGSDDNLAVSFIESSSNSKSVELVCDTPVALGATDAEAVEFWFVLPPGTLTQGFTVTVTDVNGSQFTKSTSNSIEIKSGVKKSMPAFDVVVEAPGILPLSVELNKSSLSLSVGDSEQLLATVLPDNASDKSVSWTSSDETVATVSSSGVITAIAAGTVTITATTVLGGITASCVVTIENKGKGFNWSVVSHSVVEPLENYYSRRWFVSDGVLYCDYGRKILTVDNDSHTIMTTINSSNSYSAWEIFGNIWTAPDGNVFICIGLNDDPEHSSYFSIYRFVNGNWEYVGPTYGDYEDYIPGYGVWKTKNYVYDSVGSTFYRSSNGYNFGQVTLSNAPTYFNDYNVWTSASGTVYYSDGTSHYLFNESGLSWSRLSASGWPSITASDVFIAGSITYWVSGGDVYMFNESSKTWTRIDNDFRAGLYGRYIWSYGDKYYYSDGTVNKELKQGGQSFTTVTSLCFPSSINNYDGCSHNIPICNINGNMIWGQYLKTPGTCVWNRLSTYSNNIVTFDISMSGQYYYMQEYYDDEDYTTFYYMYPIDPSSGLHSSDYQYYGEGTTFYYAQSLWKDRNGVVHYSDDKRVFTDASGRCYYCCDSNGNTSYVRPTHYRIYDETNGWSELIPLNVPDDVYLECRYFWSDGEGNIYYTRGYTQYQLVPRD